MALAALTSIIWGLAFVASQYGLASFSAPQLTALRFIIASLPALVVPRPALPWRALVLIGLTLFAGQFLLMFFAYEQGMPPGLASVSQQMQVFFTVALSAAMFRERPTARQLTGMGIAFAGLALIGLTVGGDLKPLAFGLALGAALSWAVGNVLVKRAPGVPIFPLLVWASLVPPLPALAISALDWGRPGLLAAVIHMHWQAGVALLYLGVVAMGAFLLWASLLRRYPASLVAPFALLSPCTGVVASALIFGEVFPPLRYAGMALILAGLVVILLPGRRRRVA